MNLRMLVAAAAAVLGPGICAASPNPATWHRERLLGENRTEYFLIEMRNVNCGSYYQHTESERVITVNKQSGRVVDSVFVRETRFRRDPGTGAPTVHELREPSFDLSSFLRRHEVRSPYAVTGSPVRFDSSGLFLRGKRGRKVLVPMSRVRSRTNSGPCAMEELSLLGAEQTSAPADSVLGRVQYFRVITYPAGSDVDSYELVVMIPERQIRRAMGWPGP
jgi:hypothetical protein